MSAEETQTFFKGHSEATQTFFNRYPCVGSCWKKACFQSFLLISNYGYTLRVTSQTSYSPEYTTPIQKKIMDDNS